MGKKIERISTMKEKTEGKLNNGKLDMLFLIIVLNILYLFSLINNIYKDDKI